MVGKVQILTRTVRGLTEDRSFDGFEDPWRLLPFEPCKLKTYRENPYLTDWEQTCQFFGVKDNRVVGRRNSYPARIVAKGHVYNTRISGSVFVEEKSRSSMLAITMLNKALKLPEGDLNINCGLSPVNRKFYRLYGSPMFRLVCFNVGGIWNKYYKGNGYKGWKRVAANMISVAISLLNHLSCCCFGWLKFKGLPDWKIREVDAADDAFIDRACEMVNLDSHPYREEITPAWIKWTLSNDFCAGVCKAKKIYGVYDGEALVGFALVRYSSEWGRCKIYEWQLAKEYEGQEGEFLSLMAKEMRKHGSSIAIGVGEDSVSTITFLRKRFADVGEDYAVVTMRKDSRFSDFQGIRDSTNWRVRPGMGDACFW